jgi:hypothetical protein
MSFIIFIHAYKVLRSYSTPTTPTLTLSFLPSLFPLVPPPQTVPLLHSCLFFVLFCFRNQPRCPLTNEWIRKCCMQTQWSIIQLYRKTKFVICRKMEITILSKVGQTQKDQCHHVFSYIWRLDIIKIMNEYKRETGRN